MVHEAANIKPDFTLPPMVNSLVDISRLIRELEVIDEHMLQAKLRKDGSEPKLPKTSHLMDLMAEQNKLDLAAQSGRTALRQFLTVIKQRSPVLHISFSADPQPSFIEKLVVWLRKEIHPAVLLTVGLQPDIGAGCIVRTTNRQFDFSLRQGLLKKRGLLLERLSSPSKDLEVVAAPEKAAP